MVYCDNQKLIYDVILHYEKERSVLIEIRRKIHYILHSFIIIGRFLGLWSTIIVGGSLDLWMESIAILDRWSTVFVGGSFDLRMISIVLCCWYVEYECTEGGSRILTLSTTLQLLTLSHDSVSSNKEVTTSCWELAAALSSYKLPLWI